MGRSKKKGIGFDINNFIKGHEDSVEKVAVEVIPVEETLPAEKAPKKVSAKPAAIPMANTSMSYIQENIPYGQMYSETNKQLDEAINELNMLGAETIGELQQLRASKTLRNKYNYINDMTANATSIITSKISAIKEKNKTIGDIAHLELTRMKEMKSKLNEEDENNKIANLYNAFVNTPIGGGMNVLAPPLQTMIMNGNDRPPMGSVGMEDMGTSAWQQGLDPAQNRMLLEAQNAIETVVMYDDTTGNRWYEVIDKNTRQPVPNVEKPSEASLYDLDLNVRGGYAKDTNRNVSYPLIVISNGNNSIMEY